MRFFSMMIVPSLLLGLFLGAAAQRSEPATYMNARHKQIVDAWFAKRPDLRLATDADCRNQDGLRETRKEAGQNYHPYYAVGDFNGDGKEDFAVAFKRKRKGIWSPKPKDEVWPFVIAIFNSPFTRTSVPAYTGDADLSNGGFRVGEARKRKRLVAGTFESDDCVILVPRGKRYVPRGCLDE